MADQDGADIQAMKFEAALEELEEIVAKLEQGKVDLEESISIYERGEKLKAHCEALLKKAEAQDRKDHPHQGGRSRRALSRWMWINIKCSPRCINPRF